MVAGETQSHMTSVALSLYVLGVVVTFWVGFIRAGMACDVAAGVGGRDRDLGAHPSW